MLRSRERARSKYYPQGDSNKVQQKALTEGEGDKRIEREGRRYRGMKGWPWVEIGGSDWADLAKAPFNNLDRAR